jgi:hypothetical protein
MLRASTFLLLVLTTSPLLGQWEQRLGVRAGIAQYEAEGFRTDIESTKPAIGVDYWLRRGRFAVDFGVDAYQVMYSGTYTVASADAQLLLGPADGPKFGIGVGPNLINSEGDLDFNFVPSLWAHIPAGNKQVYALLKRHTSSGNIDGDSETLMLMFGMRFGRL